MAFDPSTTKPEIDFPEGAAPTDLVIEDLVVGDGAEAKAGDSISAHYVGVAHSTGEEFDASWSRGAPWTSVWVLARSSRAGTTVLRA